ncbi:unnamed protein product [Lymnaea stagnalis]|uniref:FZ domain-containing protein n=1 Tax=Lymnaea stagnalis TaxID=6523 RepID=A0AAV2HK28_LYMST
MSRPRYTSPVTVTPHTVFILGLVLGNVFVVDCYRDDAVGYPHGGCQEMHVPWCQGLHYNETSFPNPLKHQTQEDAVLELIQFLPLFDIKCSRNIKLFVCSVYLPVCSGRYGAISPCRSLCEEARQGCEPLLNQYGFAWPEPFHCDRFPSTGICVSASSPLKKKKKRKNRKVNRRRKKLN